MLKQARVVHIGGNKYQIQVRRIWWPFWVWEKSYDWCHTNTHYGEEQALSYAKEVTLAKPKRVS